jgi:hypothetical protein
MNFIFGTVCLYVCVCVFSLRRESPDMILGDEPLISEVVLSHRATSSLMSQVFSSEVWLMGSPYPTMKTSRPLSQSEPEDSL